MISIDLLVQRIRYAKDDDVVIGLSSGEVTHTAPGDITRRDYRVSFEGMAVPFVVMDTTSRDFVSNVSRFVDENMALISSKLNGGIGVRSRPVKNETVALGLSDFGNQVQREHVRTPIYAPWLDDASSSDREIEF